MALTHCSNQPFGIKSLRFCSGAALSQRSFTAKEFDLLLFLAENPDRVYSKDALLDKVWGIENFGDSATVTVHVGKIRDKIQKDPSQHQFIETVWGAGYRFKV